MGTDLLSILIGAGIAAIARRWFTRLWWLVVPIVGTAVGFLFNGGMTEFTRLAARV